MKVEPNKFRFLVKRRSSDGSETFGVCAFMENISIEDALQVMREIGIEEAVYLDTNSVAKITCFDDQ